MRAHHQGCLVGLLLAELAFVKGRITRTGEVLGDYTIDTKEDYQSKNT